MRRLNMWTREEIVAYNLRGGGTAVTIFEEAQADRVQKARGLIEDIITIDPGRKVIFEPGCSSGDISGFFSNEHEVHGFDIVPAAVEATRARWPLMDVWEADVEDVALPRDFDILVLCEFMEHVYDPIGLAAAWLPKARYSVIGHPLVGDYGTDPEPGHVWAYDDVDFREWFRIGGHQILEAFEFPMGYRMIMGSGRRT